MEKQDILLNKLLLIIDDITFAVADGEISPTSTLFKAATEAKKLLRGSTENPETKKTYINIKYKWTKYGMLEHCLNVVNYIHLYKISFSEAVSKRAREVNKTPPSIRQACCRSLNLSSNIWDKMVKGENFSTQLIVGRLVEKYPDEKESIYKVFYPQKQEIA